MINSVNTLEFMKPKLLTMDNFNTTTTTRILPQSTSLAQATRTFVTFTHHTAMDPQQPILGDGVQQHHQEQQSRQERVKVQHLANHTKLQNNNCWNNFRTLYQLSASGGVSGGSIRERSDMMRTIRENSKSNITSAGLTSTTNDRARDDDEELVVDVEDFTSKPIANIQNKSAFNLDFITKNINNNNHNHINNYEYNSIYGNIINNKLSTETNNNNMINNFYNKQQEHNGLKQSPPASGMFVLTPIPQRTEDQDHAYRHLESVHNYAKLKSYDEDDDDIESPNGSRHSSYLDDDEDDDDDDEEENGDEDDDDNNYEDRLDPVNADDDLDPADYEDIFNRRRLQKLSTSSDGALSATKLGRSAGYLGIKNPLQFMQALKLQKCQNVKKSNDGAGGVNDDDDLHIDVDVETVETQTTGSVAASCNPTVVSSRDIISLPVKPDHHARRPMNAFLIFCKRHRAIVKERYKNLENRAITKILGDWWASLDTNDKKCFTNLAQQNKDAFFSANPNFKWYKLPAPPLRTLTTRPAHGPVQEYDENVAVYDTAANLAMEPLSNNTTARSGGGGNYFKLADEAQMGDLSQLMQDKSKTTTKQCAALQQALGETSQFMSAHITGNADILEEKKQQHLKRRFYNENSFSSNSSEEEALQPKKKSARSCKGKRYQELINSGQIATAVKKSPKSSSVLKLGSGGAVGVDNHDMEVKQNFTNFNNNIICQKRSVSESDHFIGSFDLSSFDLEEKIKDLPALDLDDYLQRKRNTKKKKKFTTSGKKRGKCSASSNKEKNNNTSPNAATNQAANQMLANTLNREHLKQQQQKNQQQQQQQAAAVGSQKRKARKESITRRDVSAIEQEVASLLPLTINGCCYFQEAPPKSSLTISYGCGNKSNEKDSKIITTTTTKLNLTSPSLIIPLQQQNSSLSAAATSPHDDAPPADILNNNDNASSSSTSDLLILAEVAANRTELKH